MTPFGVTDEDDLMAVTRNGAELEMLRVFYRAWVALHKIPRDALHRHKQELAAQNLVDAAHTLARFYKQ